MARTTKQEAQTTRTAILEAAGRVLLARGIARTSLLDIATEAGVTRGALYRHFPGKEQLLRSLWEDPLRENAFFFQAVDGQDESDPLGFLVEQLFGYLKKLPENTMCQRLFRLFLHEHDDARPGDSYSFNRRDFQRYRVQSIVSLLTASIEKKQLPPGIDVHLGAIALIAYVDGLAPQFQQLVEELGLHLETPFLINGLMHLLRLGCIRQIVSAAP